MPGAGARGPTKEGIGGSGARPDGPEEDDSGVGGTGLVAHGDTGVIGTITGFASICVGELEIRYDADSAVFVDDQPARAIDLAVGQVVEVVASGSGTELEAEQISVRHVIAGPVTRIDSERDQLEVIGQTVQLAPNAAGERAADLALGTAVEVSGLRRADGVIVASLVTRAANDALARLTGTVTRAETGRLEVAATRVDVGNGADIAAGDEVRVAGRWDGTQLVAWSVESLPRLPFDGRVARVEVEGYAGPRAGGQLPVGGFLFDWPDSVAAPAPDPDARVRVQGLVRDRRLIVERVGASELPSPPEPPRGAPNGWKNDAVDGQPRGPDGRHDSMSRDSYEPRPPRPGGARDLDPPPRIDRPDRPGAPPDRPPRFERPPLLDRPRPPERPERPERPEIHRRP